MDILSLCARDIMKQDVIKVHPDTRLKDLAKLLQEKRITGVPVVERNNKLIGVVSQTDIIRFYASYSSSFKSAHSYFKEAEKTGEARQSDVIQEAVDEFGATPVSKIMTRETFAFQESTPITQIAKSMIENHMHRVIVIDEELNLAGVISSLDMVRLLAEMNP